MIDKEPKTQRPELTRKQKLMRRTLPIVLAGAAAATVATPGGREALAEGLDNVAEAFSGAEPQFSSETSTHVMQEGDTLWNVALMVEGRSGDDTPDIVSYIEEMPENADIKDDNGLVRTGTQVYYPVSVDYKN